MMEYNPSSSGIVTQNPLNPLDEIPVGPQEFPYGIPNTFTDSNIQPYAATNYNEGVDIQNTFTDLSPDTLNTLQPQGYGTADLNLGDTLLQQTIVLPENNIYQTTTNYENIEAYPTTNYEITIPETTTYTVPELTQQYVEPTVHYESINPPTTTVETNYNLTTSYTPVTKTVLVPRVVTTYIPMSTSTGIIQPPVPIPDPIIQHSLSKPNTVPLPAPIEVPFQVLQEPVQSQIITQPVTQSVTVTQPVTQTVTVPQPNINESHFVYDYPIYEKDRYKSSIKVNETVVSEPQNLSTTINEINPASIEVNTIQN